MMFHELMLTDSDGGWPMSDVAERVKKIVAQHLDVDKGKVTESAGFIDDLGADSRAIAESW
jgi:acyl carrier protein